MDQHNQLHLWPDKSLRPSHKVSSGHMGLLPQVQGPFSGSHLEYWHQCTTDIWVLTTVQTSYSLQFKHSPPPFQGVTAASVTDPQDTAVVSQEVAALLLKWAIHMVHPLQLEDGFYFMPKQDGGLRPNLDLRQQKVAEIGILKSINENEQFIENSFNKINNTWLDLDTEVETESASDFNFINVSAACDVSVPQHDSGTVRVEGPAKVIMDEKQEVSGDCVTEKVRGGGRH
ncbi:UNVERIFIED_CONTAM: hypothetical protein FKN15_013924 [Acipenser sinensis]